MLRAEGFATVTSNAVKSRPERRLLVGPCPGAYCLPFDVDTRLKSKVDFQNSTMTKPGRKFQLGRRHFRFQKGNSQRAAHVHEQQLDVGRDVIDHGGPCLSFPSLRKVWIETSLLRRCSIRTTFDWPRRKLRKVTSSRKADSRVDYAAPRISEHSAPASTSAHAATNN